MKRRIICVLLLVFSLFNIFNLKTVFADEQIYLGGMPAGFSIETKGACIVGLSDVVTENGIKSPSKEAGIQVGDTILSVDDYEVNNAFELAKCLKNSSDKLIKIKRKGEIILITVKPEKDVTGQYKLGVLIRENINGIGTITYIKGNTFASLGHPIIDESGCFMEIVSGNLFKCNITGCIKGERGKAGELRGVFVKSNSIGSFTKNTDCGVFGKLDSNEIDYSKLTKVETGHAVIGDASIYSTVFGDSPKEYSISIIKVDDNLGTKNFVIKITDKNLLEITNGIVQGMSGSPIMQNGKLVGAVTHVFTNDPTRGFGVSIDNMLNK